VRSEPTRGPATFHLEDSGSDCADSDSDGVRRSEVAVLETVEPDSTGAHTGGRCGHVSGGPTTSGLVCSVAMHIGAVKTVALATSRNPGAGVGAMRNQGLPDGHARFMTSPGCA
jgi:hypothetical protein